MNPLYTTEAIATGAGRNGHVTSKDGLADWDLATPKEMGGAGGKLNPETLFAAGYAACYHNALIMVARQAGADLGDSSVGARVGIGPLEDREGFGLAVELEVVVPNLPHDEAQALADKAHQVCPYSNATRGNIDVTVTVVDD